LLEEELPGRNGGAHNGDDEKDEVAGDTAAGMVGSMVLPATEAQSGCTT